MSIEIVSETDYKILETLNEQQTKAVKSILGATLVIAGAGSGKTAVLTRRCAYLISRGVVPGSVLSLTFTNKAAQEMNHRIRTLLQELGINLPYVPPWKEDYFSAPLFCTFHSLGVRLLREFGHHWGLKRDFTILDSDDQTKIVREIIKEMNIDSKNLQPSLAIYFISQCKQELLLARESQRLPKEFLPTFHQIYARYEQRLKDNQTVDFDDLILLPNLILRDFGEVRTTCQDRWKHVQVDEFQDTNMAQFELVKMLSPRELIA